MRGHCHISSRTESKVISIFVSESLSMLTSGRVSPLRPAEMPSKSSSLWRSLRAYQIYGANTNVGKTIMSTILTKAFKHKFPSQNVWYLKPVSTGPLDEADDRHITRFSPDTKTKCLFQFDEAVSPHIAARSSKVRFSTLGV